MERGWKKLESERAIIGNSDQVIVIRSGTEETSKVTCTFRRYQARREIGRRHKRLVGACSISVEISLSLCFGHQIENIACARTVRKKIRPLHFSS